MSIGAGADPAAVGEVRTCFADYEAALSANDVGALVAWFWNDQTVVRFGIGDLQHGAAELTAWRRTAPPVPADRRHTRTSFTPAGDDVVVVALEFVNGDAPGHGRQSQVWWRTPEGWRIVHAHVSMVD